MDLISNVFYRTHFDVYPTGEDQKVFGEITKYIISWCKYKAGLYGITLDWDWSQFKKYGSFDGDGMKAYSTRFVDKERNAIYWSAKVYEIAKSDGFADRTWVSEFGIEQKSSDYATFSYTVMYEDRQGYYGRLQPAPMANVPSIVKYLLTDKWIVCKSGNQVLGLHAHEIALGEMECLFDALQDEARECPVIYLAANRNGEHLLDSEELAQLLAGNAKVFYSKFPLSGQEFSEVVGKEFRCPEGGLRIYRPHMHWENSDEPYRHIFFTEEKISKMGKEELFLILRRAICENIQYYTSKQLFRYDDCIALYDTFRQKKTQKLAAQAADNEFLFNDEARQLREAKAELEKVKFELQKAIDDFTREKQKNQSLKDSLGETAQLRQSLAALQQMQDWFAAMQTLPQTAEQTVKMFLLIHSDKIDLSERGWDSLKECVASSDLLWEALFDMATILRDLYLSNVSVDIVREFQQKSRFSLALTEGHETRKNNALMKLREDTYCGDPINIEPHVSFGNFRGDKSKSLRVYYDFHPNSQKIIIGCCGEHLTNYSTKKFK